MAVFSFESFAEANAFAKQVTREQKILVTLKRNGECFIVETKSTTVSTLHDILNKVPITPVAESDIANRKSRVPEKNTTPKEFCSIPESTGTVAPHRGKTAGSSGNSIAAALRLAYASQGLTTPRPISQGQKTPIVNSSSTKQNAPTRKSSKRTKASQNAGVPSTSSAAKKNLGRNKTKYSIAKSIRKTGLSNADIDRRIKMEVAREKLQAERLQREITEIRTADSLPTFVKAPIKVINYESSKIITSAKPRQKLRAICDRCGGDGGVRNGCDKCDGTGWM